MGNTSPCCFSRSNTNPASPPQSPHQTTETPEPSSVLSIKSIQKSIQEENTAEHIDKLISMLDHVLLKIKGKGEEASSSQGMEYLASTTRSASQVVDFVSTEAENIRKLDIISQELGSVATSALNAIGAAHFMFLGLSLLAYTLERYLQMKSNDSSCKELLEDFLDLAKEVKKFKEAVPGESEQVRKAIHEIVVGAVICRDCIARGSASRYWTAGIMESQLQNTKQRIKDLRDSLTLRATTYIAGSVRSIERHSAKHSVPCPSRLLEVQPVGIEDQVAEVKKLLDIGGNDQALAVVIVGFGGIGKSTLAAAVIQSLNLPSTDFKFSMVTIDQKTPDNRSHIREIQSDIICNLTGDVLYLQDPQQGRQKLQEAMANKSCFLFMDNIVDSYYVKEILPRELLPQNPSEENSESKELAQNSHKQLHKTKIRILITCRQNDLKPLLNVKNFVHEFRMLHDSTAEEFLRKTILQGKPPLDFEESMINELTKACRGVPLLWSIFGNHIKDNREKGIYEEAVKALNMGNMDRYGVGVEELISEKLMFVYDQMRDEDAQEAFLDICSYFNGWQWNRVAMIVDNATLATLHNKKLVNQSEAGTVIVHDILRLMGAKKAKETRLMTYGEFFNINDDESKLKSVKGMVLADRTLLATVETRHLNAMRHSLRFLVLGDWVRLEGPPCEKAFDSLRYLEVGDLKGFPFKDFSKMNKLCFFLNSSKPGMELDLLSPGLKVLFHRIPSRDCNEFSRLPLKNLKSLKEFIVETKSSVRLPKGFKLPPSLEHLRLISCEQLPETFGHLSALQTVYLDKCDFKCLPQGFRQSVQLTYLSLQHCTNMISLPDNIFQSLCSLRDLRLTGCTRLEKLPADIGTLTALQNLDIEQCENLRVLPENFGGLESLKTVFLDGCISLQTLPDSFGILRIEHLCLKSLVSLKDLPQSIGHLPCLKSLRLKSCHSLEFVPDSLVNLTNLDTLEVEDCIKLGSVPKNFEKLCSLKKIILSDCPLLTQLPDGFQALKTLKYMKFENISSRVDISAFIEMLWCLEELYLQGLSFSSLPYGLGKLKKLKILCIKGCHKFQTLPEDFQNLATLESLSLWVCPMLEGKTMDKIIKLQNCHYANIGMSTKLIERWNELKEENNNLPMIVRHSWNTDEQRKELDRARRVGLLCGKCIQMDSATKELNRHSSMSISNNTTIAVISLQLDHHQLLKQTLDMAKQRARSNCAGQLRIVYVCRRSDDSDAPNQPHETGKIRQVLTMLPQGISCAIPSTDIRRLSLIGRTMFDNPYVFNEGSGPKLLCFMVDVIEDDEGHQVLKDGKCVAEDEISKKFPTSENSYDEIENFDEESEISDGIVDFINCICENETHSPSGQCYRLQGENMVGELIQKLKNNNVDHLSDNKIKVDHLQEKTVAIILIDQNYPECTRLQHIYYGIKLKDSNFEAIWIPLPIEEDFGFGTYSRAIQCMPWLTLADPKLIKIADIKDKSPRVIIINSGGSMANPNALSLLMSWGADAYPFTKGTLSHLDLKSSLETLFHSTEIKWQELNNKVVFLYAEPPSQKLKMKSTLDKLVQIHGKGKFEIVYVGRFFAERNVAEILQKAYENATNSMNWSKLSFEDMMTFWYRCKYLLDEVVQEPNSTLDRIPKALLKEERWLVVVDGDGMVTTSGMDVVEMACELNVEKDDEAGIRMREELRESLREGKCSEGVRRYFRDELSHPQHHHPLRVPWKAQGTFSCNRCDFSHVRCALPRVRTPYGKRSYRCEDCDWDLCSDCWKVFVKEVGRF